MAQQRNLNKANPSMIFDPGFFIDAHLTLHPQCSTCSEFAVIKLTLLNGQAFPKFELPKGWNIVNGNLHCPKHTVTIR